MGLAAHAAVDCNDGELDLWADHDIEIDTSDEENDSALAPVGAVGSAPATQRDDDGEDVGSNSAGVDGLDDTTVLMDDDDVIDVDADGLGAVAPLSSAASAGKGQSSQKLEDIRGSVQTI